MKRTVFFLLVTIALNACTTIKLNDGNTNTITHEEGEGIAQEMSNRACRKAGEERAVIISTINKDANLPEGTGRQVTTFRCTSGTAQPVTP